MSFTVCVVGRGGREHALAQVLSRTADVVVTPGNAGTGGVSAEGFTIRSSTEPPEAIEADLYLIGPEGPLVDGLADKLRDSGRHVVGPGADGARLEGSKRYMKQLLDRSAVPTARWAAFSDVAPALEFLRTLAGGYVVKTDGLAAGKGVLVTADLAEAEADVVAKLSGSSFGSAGERVVIEEWLDGEELSLLVLCDGKRAVPLCPARDYKRALDGDEGANTGGMGSYSPVEAVGPEVVGRLMDEIIEPTVATLRADGVDYRGVLYAGVMLTAEGPRLIEYNVRFGDPEAQVVLPRLAGDLTELMSEVAAGHLRGEPRFVEEAAVCVVLAAPGYPAGPQTGDPIDGLAEADSVAGVTVFHAGTRAGTAGVVRTAGGRVLGVTALGSSVTAARELAYEAVGRISFPGMSYRSDIAAAADDEPELEPEPAEKTEERSAR